MASKAALSSIASKYRKYKAVLCDHNCLPHCEVLIFLFAASAKQIGKAQDIIDSPNKSTVGGKRSEKYMYV